MANQGPSEGHVCCSGFLAPEDCESGTRCAFINGIILSSLWRVAFHITAHHNLKVVTENFSPRSVETLASATFFPPYKLNPDVFRTMIATEQL